MKPTLSAGVAVIAIALFSGTEASAQSLRGSPASVNRIYSQAVAHNLPFYPGASSIRSAVNEGELVRLQPNANFALANVTYPYVVQETHTFVLRLASQYRSACGEKLVVTSAARPKSMQLANSVDKSVHPTGMAVDLRKPTNARCLSWLRSTLVALKSAGVLDAVEERNPPHFHVAVFPRQYGQYVQGRGEPTTSTARLASNVSTPPAATVKPSSAVAASSRTYKVRNGDSLWTIARRNNMTVAALQAANSLRTERIVSGQTLRIPTD